MVDLVAMDFRSIRLAAEVVGPALLVVLVIMEQLHRIQQGLEVLD
jgi:hypothetical protein